MSSRDIVGYVHTNWWRGARRRAGARGEGEGARSPAAPRRGGRCTEYTEQCASEQEAEAAATRGGASTRLAGVMGTARSRAQVRRGLA